VPPDLAQQVRAPCRQVGDRAGQTARVKGGADDVDRRIEHVRVDQRQQPITRPVRRDDIELPVEHESGPRVVRGEHEVEHLEQCPGPLGRRAGVVVLGRVARREQDPVAVGEWDVEGLRQAQHHLPARPGAAGLHEGEVARRRPAHVGEVELGEPAALAPLAQEHAGEARTRRHGGHGGDRTYASRTGAMTSEVMAPFRLTAAD
jgi:hypothetical protein